MSTDTEKKSDSSLGALHFYNNKLKNKLKDVDQDLLSKISDKNDKQKENDPNNAPCSQWVNVGWTKRTC
jgi:hypothetical protein